MKIILRNFRFHDIYISKKSEAIDKVGISFYHRAKSADQTTNVLILFLSLTLGTAMGIVVGGFGGGALVFNQIQTALVNLENYQVDKSFIPFEQEKLYALCVELFN